MVLKNGTIGEFDSPLNLILNPQSLFLEMLLQMDPDTVIQLTNRVLDNHKFFTCEEIELPPDHPVSILKASPRRKSKLKRALSFSSTLETYEEEEGGEDEEDLEQIDTSEMVDNQKGFNMSEKLLHYVPPMPNKI